MVYKGLWWYTRVYIGIEGFMGVYKGLWGYTRVHKGVYLIQRYHSGMHVHSYAAFFCCIHLYEGKFGYQEIINDWWNIPWYTTRKCLITILYHAIISTVVNKINEVHYGKVGCNAVEYTITYSDWLYLCGML